MAEQFVRGSKANGLKRQTHKERRQMERAAARAARAEVDKIRDRVLDDVLAWADCVTPPRRLPYYGWND